MNLDAEFSIGDRVRIRSQPRQGTVIGGPRRGADTAHYEVSFADGQRSWVEASQLEVLPEETLRFVDKTSFLGHLAVLKLSHRYSDVLYSIGASKTRFLVYQFQPVFKFVQSLPHGMLIADEVGLGKTIEAGLILKELVARGSVRRVLVVCPANLRDKWQTEMQQRFGFDFVMVDAQNVRRMRDQMESGQWPEFFGIASLEGLRRGELREIIQDTSIQFDLVVVDEAHHLRNPGTQSFELGEVLSDQTDYLLLLSATPVHLGQGDLLSLLKLVDPDQFARISKDELTDFLEPNRHINRALASLRRTPPDPSEAANELIALRSTALASAFADNPLVEFCAERLLGSTDIGPAMLAEIRRDLQQLHTLAPYYTRTRKREVEASARRRSQVQRVVLTHEEREFYDRWFAYLRRQARDFGGFGLALSTKERQAASCLPAVAGHVDTTLTGEWTGGLETNSPMPGVEQVLTFSDDPDGEMALREAASAAAKFDSKGDRFLSVLDQMLKDKTDRKILVFAFFKDTLRHLAKRLSQTGVEFSLISGDNKPEERARIVQDFRDRPDARVLLSSEVGAEGLDFQFCDCLINYDLPWNPMRVEQRIGRIDRFGQREPVVQVVSFFVEETIDTRILLRLYERIRVFEESIGELEPILGPISELESQIFSPNLSDEELVQEAEAAVNRVENLRLQQTEFESASASLLDQGDVVRREVESLISSGRHLSSEEVRSLLAVWLQARRSAQDDLEATSIPGVWKLWLSPETVGRIRHSLAGQRYDPRINGMLNWILERRSIRCTFESEVAQRLESPRLVFIDFSSPFIKLALADAQADTEIPPFARAAVLRRPVDSEMSAPLICCVYQLELSGLDPRLLLLAVAVDLKSGQVVEGVGDEILGTLAACVDARATLDESLSLEDLKTLEQVAFEHADRRRLELEQWWGHTQDARVQSRRAAVENTYQRRIARSEALRDSVADPAIKRLHEGRVRNQKAELEAKLQDLSSAVKPLGTLELLAVALITE
jgi:superfamily II DNA or RNA helicase